MKAFRIATKVNTLTGLCSLVALATTLGLLFRMQTHIERDQRVLTAFMHQAEQARTMQVEFKKQVQEWKDILLRGHDAGDFEKFRASFLRQERLVQEIGTVLRSSLMRPPTQAMASQFLAAHEELGRRYRSALEGFVRSGYVDYRSADHLLRGADRAPTDLVDEIVDSIAKERDEYEASHAAAMIQEQRYTVVFVASVFLGLMAAGMWIGRRITTPIRSLALTVSRVAAGRDYSVRAVPCSRDELGLLAVGFNEMLARIEEQNAALQESRDNLETRVEQRTRELRREVVERQRAEEAVRRLNTELEDRVNERTAELRRSQQELADFIENATEGLHRVGDDGCILWANQAELDLLGYTREEYVGHPIAEFHADREIIDDILARLVRGEALCNYEARLRCKDGSVKVVLINSNVLRDEGKFVHTRCFTRDITERERVEKEIHRLNDELEMRVVERTQQLEDLHRRLLDSSRQAGMAEVATSVLHNVGNVLNSVNVSAAIVAERVRRSKAGGVARVATLLREHDGDLPAFLSSDPQGREVPAFLELLGTHLAKERAGIVEELESLRKNIDHIKDIVAMQQSYAKVSGLAETVPLVDLVEDALRMNAGALAWHEVEVVREFQARPTVMVEKHKVLQILVNLIRNAKHACDEAGKPDKRVTVRVAAADDRATISIIDNGVGIPRENLTRIFAHGFTTRKDGHGFGLHSGALAAKELGGALHAHSAGPGAGAVFTLEIPQTTLINGQTCHEHAN